MGKCDIRVERLCNMYESAIEQIQTEKEEIKSFRLATVSALFSDGCPQITFFGEVTPSEKKYKVIDNTSYSEGDTVLVGIVNDGYIILGAIGFSPRGDNGVIYLTESQANLLFATKDHTHAGYSPSSHTHSSIQLSGFNLAIVNLSGSTANYYVRPSSDNNCHLGYTGSRFSTVYAATSTISTSDENQKHHIEEMDERYELLLKSLKPKRYKYVDGTSDRYHTGFIAQSVKKSMDEVGLSDLEFAAFIKTPRVDEDGSQVDGCDYGLRYEEFIALNTMMIQKLLTIVEDQNIRIEQLERRLHEQDISN